MKPERIAALRRQCTGATWPKLSCKETVDLLETVEELRALCGEADSFIEPDYGGTISSPRNAIKSQLQAASKGEQ